MGLIDRVGFTSRVRYTKGFKLIKYCTLVHNRIRNELSKDQTLLQKLDELSPATPETGYQNTYSFLKHKEGNQKPSNPKPQKQSHSKDKLLESEYNNWCKQTMALTLPIIGYEKWLLTRKA